MSKSHKAEQEIVIKKGFADGAIQDLSAKPILIERILSEKNIHSFTPEELDQIPEALPYNKASQESEKSHNSFDLKQLPSFEEYENKKSASAPTEPRQLARFAHRGLDFSAKAWFYWTGFWAMVSHVTFLIILLGVPINYLLLEEISSYFLWIIGLFVSALIFYILSIPKTRCPTCRCPILWSRNCHKNRKAHSFWGHFYVAATALHGIFLRWMRCMYCGNSFSLKPKKKVESIAGERI